MDVSLLLTLAQTVVQLVDSSSIKEIESLWSFKSQLAKIKDTMSTITAVLLDAEEQERRLVQQSNVDRDWLEKLRDAIYQADDLFDEVVTVGERRKLMSGEKMSKKVHLFFSPSNQLAFAFKVSCKIKKIRERLDNIANDHRDFSSRPYVGVVERMARMRRREESHSLVRVEDVVGRDNDKKAVIDLLLNSTVKEDIYFLTVVGIGGLGKTTLAQLVYNDERICSEFPIKLWVCVGEEFDLKALVCNVLESATNQRHSELRMDQLQSLIREKIDGKKYLLVLDDVWNEDRNKWLNFRDLLIGGGRGSRVIITTRSKSVATTIERGFTYELQDLSSEDSWHLFAKMAFEKRNEQTDVELMEIGKQIVKKCANVPLAIRVVGSLLYGQNKSTWLSFKNFDLASVKQDKNGVIPVLKFSYYHLESPLKRCFNYCALFPKDYKIFKVVLIGHWMAHGFILPLAGQRVEDAGEEYFLNLLQRGFFQDIERDEHGEIVSCKIHYLMHDLAREVAGTDILVVNSVSSRYTGKARHLLIDGIDAGNITSSLIEMKRLRTFFRLCYDTSPDQSSINDALLSNTRTFFKLCYDTSPDQSSISDALLSNARYLRVLDLRGSTIKSLPGNMGLLLHLRYVDLSDNYDLELLPSSITKLNNLQTLKLKWCRTLKELPRNLRKLVNLRHLDIFGCNRLDHMPPGMNSLTSLHTLTMFVEGGSRYFRSSKRTLAGQLEDLEALTNLRGSLTIKVQSDSTVHAAKLKKASYVMGMEFLKDMFIDWWERAAVSEALDQHDHAGVAALMEALQPHPNLKGFRLEGYPAATFPNWALSEDLGASLPNLLIFSLSECRNLKHLPLLSQLRYLTTLELFMLLNLEFIESADHGSYDQGLRAYFPSLRRLRFWKLPQLKWWWKPGVEQAMPFSRPYSLAHLSYLEIRECADLNCFPFCPNLEELVLIYDFKDDNPRLSSSSSLLNYLTSMTTTSTNSDRHPHTWNLKSITIDSVGFLSYLPLECFQCVSHLNISYSKQLESLSIVEELFQRSLSSSLHTLRITSCPKLKSLCGGLKHLTALNELQLWFLDDLEALPECMNCLTSLQSLHLLGCPRLKLLPDAMCTLTSLVRLQIQDCSGLADRCREPTGEDWHKIRHIPHVLVEEGVESPQQR